MGGSISDEFLAFFLLIMKRREKVGVEFVRQRRRKSGRRKKDGSVGTGSGEVRRGIEGRKFTIFIISVVVMTLVPPRIISTS